MLRRWFLAGAAVWTVHAQSGAGSADVRKAIDSFIAAVTKNDLAGVSRHLSDDLIYTHSTGLVETKQQYLEKVKSGEQKYASIELLNPTIRVYGNTAVVNTRVRMTGATKGVPFDNTLFLIHVWVKQGNDWKLVAHQTTRKQ